MKVYSYDPNTMYFNGWTMANPSPLEPGVWLHPAHTTEVEPPDFDPVTHTCQLQNGIWVLELIPLPEPEPEPDPEPEPEPDTPEQVKAKLLAFIAFRRYIEETKGIIFNGITINTERESQNLINGAVVSTLLDPTCICNWKTPDGWVPLNADAMKAIGLAVRAHVQSCFDREGVLVSSVQADTYTPEMLDEGWPT
jgi:hypothetical protein